MSYEQRIIIDDMLLENRSFNIAGMYEAGFVFDPGRVLPKDEVEKLQLTPPDRIRDCHCAGEYHWR